MPTKAELRKRLRAARAALSERYRTLASHAAARLALSHGLLRRKGRFGFYIPRGAELDPLPLLNRALWLKKACYLPRLGHRSVKRLFFVKLEARSSSYLNRFGIPEITSSGQPVRARQLQVLFMPLVGFDEDGNRLGMGGGFYDASLDFLRRRRNWRRPLLIGLAYECQRVSNLPRERWDVPLDGLLSEQRFIRFRRKSGVK
jgi:5-formyltetrahydrofolate cyclo-ligase